MPAAHLLIVLPLEGLQVLQCGTDRELVAVTFGGDPQIHVGQTGTAQRNVDIEIEGDGERHAGLGVRPHPLPGHITLLC